MNSLIKPERHTNWINACRTNHTTSGTGRINRFRFVAKSLIALAMALLPGLSMAQTLPSLVVESAQVFEGNSKTRVVRLPIHFEGEQPYRVTGRVSAIPLPIASAAATGGSVLGGGADFLQYRDIPFEIPPNAPKGSVWFEITVMGDTVIEPDEMVILVLSNVKGAVPVTVLPDVNFHAVAAILNDDGPPEIIIDDTSVMEDTSYPGLRSQAHFTVSLSHPSETETRVNFKTRSGTATTDGYLPDYTLTKGACIIPAGQMEAEIIVTVISNGDGDADETFFVDLSNPVNGTIADRTGQCTITNGTIALPPQRLPDVPEIDDERWYELLQLLLDYQRP